MNDRVYEAISINQLGAVLSEVHRHHQWPLNGRRIKYVDWHFDNRDAKVFTVVFRHGGGAKETTFTASNRFNRETMEMEDVKLFPEVMDWLIDGRAPEEAYRE